MRQPCRHVDKIPKTGSITTIFQMELEQMEAFESIYGSAGVVSITFSKRDLERIIEALKK